MTWIFGYGSLMWRPEFPFRERRPALLKGYHRSFCRLSFRHRGTPRAPGMVVGLEQGGSCLGYAFLPEPGSEQATLAALDAREGDAYHRQVLPVESREREKNPGDGRNRGGEPDGGRNGGRDEIGAGDPDGGGGGGKILPAHTYLPVQGHPTHVPGLPPGRMAALIASGEGESGTARDYLCQLLAALKGLGASEPEMEAMLARVRRLRGQNPAPQ